MSGTSFGALVVRRRRNPVTFDALHTTHLQPWAYKLAHKIVNYVGKKKYRGGYDFPPTKLIREWVQKLTGHPFPQKAAWALLDNPEFRDYCVELRKSNIAQTKALRELHGPLFAKIEKASAVKLFKAEEYRGAADVAQKALASILPKTPDVLVAQQINVNIRGPNQFDALQEVFVEPKEVSLDEAEHTES